MPLPVDTDTQEFWRRLSLRLGSERARQLIALFIAALAAPPSPATGINTACDNCGTFPGRGTTRAQLPSARSPDLLPAPPSAALAAGFDANDPALVAAFATFGESSGEDIMPTKPVVPSPKLHLGSQKEDDEDSQPVRRKPKSRRARVTASSSEEDSNDVKEKPKPAARKRVSKFIDAEAEEEDSRPPPPRKKRSSRVQVTVSSSEEDSDEHKEKKESDDDIFG